MFVYGWSVLGLRFGLLLLSFYPMGSFVLRVKDRPVYVCMYVRHPQTGMTHFSPEALLTNFNDGGGGGGPTEVHILYPKKITTSEFVYPKNSLLFLAYPKKSLSPFFGTQKNTFVFFFVTPKKIPASFIDPKNHFWPKFQTQKNHSAPPPPRH